MAGVAFESVSKYYDGVEAVRELSLELEDGEFFALLGPPGAGKTSTLKMVAGVESATEGDILFDGETVNTVPPHRRDVAMVFESYALYPHLTAFENIAYPLRERRRSLGYSETDIEERVSAMAELLQISKELPRRPAYLSGGQRQRVALGRALVRDPRVFLLDEPIAHLDARLRHMLRGELRRIQRKRGTTTIYATPDYLEAVAMADRIGVIFDGQLHQIGTPSEILRSPATARVAEFVGDPPMNLLSARVVTRDGELMFECDGLDVAVPTDLQPLLEGSSHDEVLIGFRPNDARVSSDKGCASACCCNLYVAERLHRKSILTLESKAGLIKVNCERDFAGRVGDRVWLDFPEDRLCVFDPKTLLRFSAED